MQPTLAPSGCSVALGSYVIQDATGALHPSNVAPYRLKLISTSEVPPSHEFEVESIVDHHGSGPARQYLVKWAGWDSKHNSWQSAQDLANAPEAVNAYFSRRKLGESGVEK